MIQISAQVTNQENQHEITLSTNGNAHNITIPPKSSGFGSSANGGEVLFLALATCYCNDIYREAAKRNITVHQVDVQVSGEFAPEAGAIAENVVYHVTVSADADDETIRALIEHTDTVAEVQNTLRQGISVTLGKITTTSST